MSRPAQAIVDLAALRHNYQVAVRQSDNAQAVAVIKANAYGHGAIEIAQALEPLAPAFAVAAVEEALQLRHAGIEKPILLLEGPFTSQDIQIAAEYDFWLMICDPSQVDMVVATVTEKPLNIWLKADSGMHRMGLGDDHFRSAYHTLQALPHVQREIVLATHFACADQPDNDFTATQIAAFHGMTEGLNAPVSMSNSAAILGWEASHGEFHRPGIMLYGANPFVDGHPEGDQLQAVMTLKSGVIGVRDVQAGDTVGYTQSWVAQRPSKIATVAMGYGDGYPRQAPSGTPVIINGQRATIVGCVSMDMITLDVTDVGPVQVGDEVIFWGAELSLNEVAAWAGTISYELITRMPMRTPRIYINQ